MTVWILAVLGLWLAQVFFAASFRIVLTDDPQAMTMDHMRGKDAAPELSQLGGRAVRAQANLAESLPIFLGLALLLEIQGAPGLGVTGAITYLVGRVLYTPAYLLGVFGLRTTMWSVGFVGLAMMAWAAVSAS